MEILFRKLVSCWCFLFKLFWTFLFWIMSPSICFVICSDSCRSHLLKEQCHVRPHWSTIVVYNFQRLIKFAIHVIFLLYKVHNIWFAFLVDTVLDWGYQCWNIIIFQKCSYNINHMLFILIKHVLYCLSYINIVTNIVFNFCVDIIVPFHFICSIASW